MSSALLFGVGVFVFFLTVYGVVMAGGLLLLRKQVADDEAVAPDPELPGALRPPTPRMT